MGHSGKKWGTEIGLIWLALLFGFLGSAQAAGLDWSFPKFGRLGFANFDGTWTVVRPLELIDASPEFQFPLELVYQSAGEEVGLFGPKWSCPQLESRLLPGKLGILVWKMPSGVVVGLYPRKGYSGEYLSADGNWKAEREVNKVVISNREGWKYLYKVGQLIAVTSPTQRELEVIYQGNQPSQILLRDTASNKSFKLLDLEIANKRLVALVSRNGKFSFDFDRGNPARLVKVVRPGLMRPEQIGYSKENFLHAIATANGSKTTFTTNAKANSPARECRLLSDGTYSYRYVDPLDSRNPGYVEIEDAAKAKQSLSYEPKRGVLRVKDAGGVELATYFYRAPGQKFDGKLRRIERNGQLLVEHYYEPKTGRISQTKDVNGQFTFYEYAELGNRPEESPLFDKPIRISKGNRKTKELVKAFEYDRQGRVIASKGKDGEVEATFKYNGRNELSTVTGIDGKDQALERDEFGRLQTTRRGELVDKVSYDDTTGKLQTRWLPDGQRVDYLYDEAGRNVGVKQNHVVVQTLIRDELGRVVGSKDALGRETKLTLDEKGNVLTEKQANGVTNRYEYDAKGKRTAQIDGNGNKVSFKYDGAGRLVEQVNAIGQKLTWTYDKAGQLIQRTNGEQTVQYAYDAKGRLKVINYGALGEKLVHDYDVQGRLIRVASPTIELKLHRDEKGRVLAKEMISRGKERVIRYDYTALGQKKSVALAERNSGEETYRLLNQTEYGYDESGRLAVLRANGRHICSYRYDAAGRLIARSYGNGIEGRYGYDKFGRMTLLEFKGGPLVEPMLLAYEWDAAGQVTRRAWHQEMQQYDYDGAGQLAAVRQTALNDQSKSLLMAASSIPKVLAPSGGDLVEAYNYDPAGNIIQKTEYGETTRMTYDKGNQLVSAIGGTGPTPSESQESAFAYDQAGRQTKIQGPEGAVRRTYGWLDKVVELELPDGRKLGLDYYPDGQLAAKGTLNLERVRSEAKPAEAPSKPMDFLKRLLAAKAKEKSQFDETLQASPAQQALETTEEYVWDDLALIWRNGTAYAVEPHPNGGTPVAVFTKTDEAPTFLLSDILGTTLAAVKPDQVEIIPLTVFGKPLAQKNNALASVNTLSSDSLNGASSNSLPGTEK